MIIQCEKCQTKFRLDDSRVTDKGVKVRCTRCKHVFMVQKAEPETESFEPGGAFAEFSSPAAQGEAPAAIHEGQHFAAESVPDAPFDSAFFENTSLRSEPTAGEGDVDFYGFNFTDSDSVPDLAAQSVMSVDDIAAIMIEPAADVPRKEVPEGPDFSEEDLSVAVVQNAPEALNGTSAFDFEDSSFAEPMDTSGRDLNGNSGTSFSLDTPGDAPFNPGEIDFGYEIKPETIQQVNPEDLNFSQEMLSAHLAETHDKATDDDLPQSFLEKDSIGAEQELPPLPIASRRKQSSLYGAVVAVIALLVISVLGYLGYSSFSALKETAVPETGKIGVRAVKAAFIENKEAGDLLVISGEAFNEYPKPRAALQIKVTVFDAAGQSTATKSAYSGNPLTEEQLKSLPLDKIEAVMANQFGDSLANMEVAPGKAIPFVVVLANLPKGAKDFGVQSVGSTVATGKQQ
jgi:predicted Zn finger-like uncharacterized protein